MLILITFLIASVFTGGIVYGVQGLVSEEADEGTLVDGVKLFRIEASQWNFSPSAIKVNPGDRVRFIVISADIMHGFAMNEWGFNLALTPGLRLRHEVTIPADFPEGVYANYCSIFCGIGHPYMKGRIMVGNPALFLGVGMGKILPYGATVVMAGVFTAFIIAGRRRQDEADT